jgi:glycosyltransferase involved in cell wall biosynthesis
MKIAYLISEYLPSIGGAQICVHNIATELKRDNNDVVVITTTREGKRKNYGYHIERISKWFLKLLRVAFIGKYLLWYQLNKLQKKHRFDIWQVTVGFPLGAYALGFFKNRKIPCVLRCAGEDIQINKELSYGYRLSPSVDKVIRRTYPLYDRVVALTESVKTEYKNLGIPDEKISIIPNGVSMQRFKNRGNREEIKKKHNLNGKTVLLTIGRNHPKKGYNLIPHILKEISENRDDVVWIIIGKGCTGMYSRGEIDNLRGKIFLKEEIEAKANDSSLEIPSPALIEYYQGADLFVFPSYIETFGMVLIEANASGLPVVTSDVPGCRDVVSDGYNGLLAEGGNYKMFAEKIKHILYDKSLYDRICSNLPEHVKQFEWGLIAREYRTLYEDVMAGYKD